MSAQSAIKLGVGPPLVLDASQRTVMVAPAAPPADDGAWRVEPWFYRDPNGRVQGPFEARQMRQWFNAGYFDDDLSLRQGEAGAFHALGTLFAAAADAFSVKPRVPKAPPPAPAEGEDRQTRPEARGLPASLALRAAAVLGDAVLLANLEACRGQVERYMRRVAAPAVARFVLYDFASRVIYFEGERHDGGPIGNWYSRKDQKDWFMGNDVYEIICSHDDKPWGSMPEYLEYDELRHIMDTVPEELSSEPDEQLWSEKMKWVFRAVEDMVEDDDRWLRFCLRGCAKGFPGFAGYDRPEGEKDCVFIEALPERVMQALAAQPPERTLDFCAFLRAAHGVADVDDIELAAQSPWDDSEANDQIPSTTLNFVNVYPNNRLNGAQAWASFVCTIAYVPARETLRPVPITSTPYTFDHGFGFRDEQHRATTAREICAHGPIGASLPRLRKD